MAHSESWGSGRYSHLEANYLNRYGVEGIDTRALALRKLLTELHTMPEERVGHFIRKAMRMFDLGTQVYLYARDATLGWGGRVNSLLEAKIVFYSRVFTSIFLALLLATLAKIAISKDVPIPALIPLAYISVISLLLIVLGENQQRYLYPLWYIGPVYFGLLFRTELPCKADTNCGLQEPNQPAK
jgi:hypothetical protein